jgi:hypothetical protein
VNRLGLGSCETETASSLEESDRFLVGIIGVGVKEAEAVVICVD